MIIMKKIITNIIIDIIIIIIIINIIIIIRDIIIMVQIMDIIIEKEIIITGKEDIIMNMLKLKKLNLFHMKKKMEIKSQLKK